MIFPVVLLLHRQRHSRSVTSATSNQTLTCNHALVPKTTTSILSSAHPLMHSGALRAGVFASLFLHDSRTRQSTKRQTDRRTFNTCLTDLAELQKSVQLVPCAPAEDDCDAMIGFAFYVSSGVRFMRLDSDCIGFIPSVCSRLNHCMSLKVSKTTENHNSIVQLLLVFSACRNLALVSCPDMYILCKACECIFPWRRCTLASFKHGKYSVPQSNYNFSNYRAVNARSGPFRRVKLLLWYPFSVLRGLENLYLLEKDSIRAKSSLHLCLSEGSLWSDEANSISSNPVDKKLPVTAVAILVSEMIGHSGRRSLQSSSVFHQSDQSGSETVEESFESDAEDVAPATSSNPLSNAEVSTAASLAPENSGGQSQSPTTGAATTTVAEISSDSTQVSPSNPSQDSGAAVDQNSPQPETGSAPQNNPQVAEGSPAATSSATTGAPSSDYSDPANIQTPASEPEDESPNGEDVAGDLDRASSGLSAGGIVGICVVVAVSVIVVCLLTMRCARVKSRASDAPVTEHKDWRQYLREQQEVETEENNVGNGQLNCSVDI